MRIVEADDTATILAQSRQPTVGYCYWASVAVCIGQVLGQRRSFYVDCLNLPTFSQNLAQYRPYNKPIVTFTMACSSVGPLLCQKQVLAGILELPFQQRHDIGNWSSATFFPILGQCWTVSTFALGSFQNVITSQFFITIK